jgi:hypothetical protein
VASGTGAEAPAAAGSVGAAPVSFGRRWSCRSGAGWASGRGWRSPGEAWAVLVDGGGSSAMVAAAWARRRRRRLRMRAGETERNETDAGAGSVKIHYFRRPPRKPSDISLCPTAYRTAVGHKIMSDGPPPSPRTFSLISDGC